ncbi:hypothetical protein PYW08_016665 [Mythimna loreyi]|uniref:Uncharacterized protein n=1 Tax=Mythimna loreyi TaxID=667449 RepID=A0ACC2R0D0_9NEOP|nr:hypothetical protein PYW08_016665 [Mythimna loreyi]
MPDYLRDHVVNLYIENFVKQEAIFKAAGVPKNVKALNEVREPLLKDLEKTEFHTVICCKDDGDEQIKEIVGASMMILQMKGYAEPELNYKFETQELKKLLEIFSTLTAHFDELKVFNLDRNFSDRGAFVCPEYRGLGITDEFLKVRKEICKEYGIPINGAWVTSYGMWKAAERGGWETITEIPFQELGRKHGVTFENNPPFCKFMLARLDI